MKKYSKIAALLAAGAMTMLTACDEVKSDDRYIELPATVVERAVLLEDFTGQGCLNCPLAHEIIENMEEQYGTDHLIAVSIHCGTFGIDKRRTNFANGTVGLMQMQGNKIMQAYGISEFPMGVINMKETVGYLQWAAKVREAIEKTTDVQLKLDVEYTPDTTGDGNTGTIRMQAHVKCLEEREAGVQFWIVENNIVATQRLPDGSYNDAYVHNNIFRAMVFDSLDGTPVTLTPDEETTVDGEIQTIWNNQEHWLAENLSVVAFVKDANGVQQVVRVPVIK